MARVQQGKGDGIDSGLREQVNQLSGIMAVLDEQIRGVNIMSGRDLVEDDGEDLEVPAGAEVDDEDMGDDECDSHADDAECGPPEEVDMVDEAIEGVIGELEKAGYSEEDAEEAVYDAMSDLIDAEAIDDTPDMDQEAEVKALWVQTAVPKVKDRLKEMGLEF